MTPPRRTPQFSSSAVVTLPGIAAAQVRLSEPLPYSPDSWFEMARNEFCGERDARDRTATKREAFAAD